MLKPGGPGSKAATGSKSKGHGRNWAVEGAVAWDSFVYTRHHETRFLLLTGDCEDAGKREMKKGLLSYAQTKRRVWGECDCDPGE